MHSEPVEAALGPAGPTADVSDVSDERDEPRLDVAAAARRLGVAPSTLRTWDRRYGMGPSDHVSGQHRRYSPEDVARLELMLHALVRGASPAEAARFALAARLPHPAAAERPRSVATPPGPDLSTEPVEDGHPLLAHTDGAGEIGARVRVGGRVLRLPGADRRARGLGRAALALDAVGARAVLIESIATDGIDVTWELVARPVLTAVADRWAYTGAGVEIEHLLSECLIGVFGAHATAAPPVPDVRPVLLAGMPGEQHMLPMVVLAAALADRQVPCRSLGPNLPGDALVAAIRRTAPVAVVLWSQMSASSDLVLLRTLPRTRPRFRTFVAGPGWSCVDLPPRVVALASLAEAADALMAVAAA